ncbi:hypothetical protein BKA66DRAFT_311647 [Pyrenochaeta sp. MPI-SDFR-AT-0127]|nr:hypothetical protein BKA66DRAFT_311647 [Pyrenochaeta sp. MPI-SDFR-AT-0127]
MTTTPTISSGCSTGHLLLKTTPPIYNQQSAFTRPFALRSGHTKILSAHYLSRFMQHVHPTFPILSGELVARFQHAIDEENEIQSDEMCILYMALAIGAIFPSVDSVTDARVACELWSVVSRAETVNEESINMIRLLILLVLFSLLQDGFGSSWHLEELAVRTCIILGYQDRSTHEIDQAAVGHLSHVEISIKNGSALPWTLGYTTFVSVLIRLVAIGKMPKYGVLSKQCAPDSGYLLRALDALQRLSRSFDCLKPYSELVEHLHRFCTGTLSDSTAIPPGLTHRSGVFPLVLRALHSIELPWF